MKTKKPGADSLIDLEQESQRMEERLHMLKKMMSIEKASRESSAGHFWGSSQPPRHESQSKTSGTGELESVHGQKGHLRVKVLTDKAGEERVPLSRKCGQCEKPLAKVTCIECGEKYCLTCFAKFHQKGALSRHRVKPIKAKGKLREMKASNTCGTTTSVFQDHSTGKNNTRELRETVRETAGNGDSSEKALWEGEYDEKASALSFQEALAEWRGAHLGASKKPATQDTPQAASCSTQTSANDSQPSLRPLESEREISFGKFRGGVSYFEKMMIRRLQTDPRALLPFSSPLGTANKTPTNAGVDSEESESDDDERACPSQYNLFHSRKSGDFGASRYTYASQASPIPSSSETITELPSRPTSTVQIKAVEFGNRKCRDSSTQVLTTAPQGKKQVTKSRKNKSKELDKNLASQRPKSVKKEKRKEKVTNSTASNPISLKEPLSSSSSDEHAFSETVRRILRPHTHVDISFGSHSSSKLSSFFLSGVEEGKRTSKDDGLPKGKEEQENSSYTTSSRALPISATVWLPENSLLPTESKAIGKQSEALECSIYCIETDLPPPSTLARSQINPSGTVLFEETDSESEREEANEHFQAGLSGEDTTEERRKDLEVLEELAWELQSLTSGRCTRCSGAESDGDSEGGETPGWDDEKDGEQTREELEAEIERVKSSFEIYHQQLMQCDSD